MLFFCFSSLDRHSIVEAILYHVTNYQIPVWYDRQKMLLGNDRNYMNFVDGIEKNRYALIILSRNTLNSVCACEEIKLIHERFLNNDMYVFPIFYNMKSSELPANMKWMTKLVYKELTDKDSSLGACNHIICKILKDELENYRITSIKEYSTYFKSKSAYIYLNQLVESYCKTDNMNYNAKISLLYAACLYIMNRFNIKDAPAYYTAGVYRFFAQTQLNLNINLREIAILETLFLLLINVAVFGYFIQN